MDLAFGKHDQLGHQRDCPARRWKFGEQPWLSTSFNQGHQGHQGRSSEWSPMINSTIPRWSCHNQSHMQMMRDTPVADDDCGGWNTLGFSWGYPIELGLILVDCHQLTEMLRGETEKIAPKVGIRRSISHWAAQNIARFTCNPPNMGEHLEFLQTKRRIIIYQALYVLVIMDYATISIVIIGYPSTHNPYHCIPTSCLHTHTQIILYIYIISHMSNVHMHT